MAGGCGAGPLPCLMDERFDMWTRLALALALFALGCAKDEADPTKPATDGLDPGTDATGGDADETTPDPPASLRIEDVSAASHDEIGSIVVVTWTQSEPADVHLAFSFADADPRTSPVRSLGAGTHSELLLGVPYGAEVTYRIVAEGEGSQAETEDAVAVAAALPEALPVPTLLAADPSAYDPDSPYIFAVTMRRRAVGSDSFWAMIVDREGRVVWGRPARPERSMLHARPGWHGRSLLIDNNSFWTLFDGGVASTIDRIAIDGTVIETFDAPGLHHPFTDLPDGAVAYGAHLPGQQETLEIASPEGNTTLWRCGPWLGALGVTSTCASNTLDYNEATNTFLFSFYTIETIVEVDADSGTATRWFGHVPGSWSFDPPESAFYWQHGGHITPQGTLLTSSLDEARGETIVREYRLDEAAETLEEVWSFGIGDGVFGDIMGEAHRLSNGNTLHNTGSLARLREATADGTVAWDLAWDDAYNIGRTTPIADLYAFALDRP